MDEVCLFSMKLAETIRTKVIGDGMKSKVILFLFAASILMTTPVLLAGLFQTAPVLSRDGQQLDGYVRATILVYDGDSEGELVWTGTTDGSLPV